MFFLTLCLLFIIRLRFPTGKSIAEIKIFRNAYCRLIQLFESEMKEKDGNLMTAVIWSQVTLCFLRYPVGTSN